MAGKGKFDDLFDEIEDEDFEIDFNKPVDSKKDVFSKDFEIPEFNLDDIKEEGKRKREEAKRKQKEAKEKQEAEKAEKERLEKEAAEKEKAEQEAKLEAEKKEKQKIKTKSKAPDKSLLSFLDEDENGDNSDKDSDDKTETNKEEPEKMELTDVKVDIINTTDAKGKPKQKKKVTGINKKGEKVVLEEMDENPEQDEKEEQQEEANKEEIKKEETEKSFEQKASDLLKMLDDEPEEEEEKVAEEENKELENKVEEIQNKTEEVDQKVQEFLAKEAKEKEEKEIVNRIDNEPKVGSLTEEEPEVEEKPEVEAEVITDQQKAEEKFAQALADYNSATSQNTGSEKLEEFTNSFSGDKMKNISMEFRNSMFLKEYSNFYKQGLQDAIKANEKLKQEGKEAPSLVDTVKAYDTMQKAAWEVMKEKGVVAKDYDYPDHGYMSAKEIRDMQMNSFLSSPESYQKASEKKEINNMYKEANATQRETNGKVFHDFIDKLNAAQGTRFSSKGIETYLTNRWKNAPGKDVDEQRENFQKEYNEFVKKAYENMMTKSGATANKEVANRNFDTFTKQIELMCKNNGWLNKEQQHEFCNGMTSKDMRDIQTNVMNQRPKNLGEWANIQAKRTVMSGTKDINKFLSDLTKNLPEAKDKMDNLQIRNILAYKKALQTQHDSRKANRSNASINKSNLESKIIDVLNKKIEEKGYDKSVLDFLNKNPLKPEKDPINQQYEQEKNAIEENQRHNDKLAIEQNEINAKGKEVLNRQGVQITVPEADNIKEIVNPEVKSEPVNMEKSKQLDIQAPQQNQGK